MMEGGSDMARSEILEAMRAISGRCDVGGICRLTPQCEYGNQVASELDGGGENDAIKNPGYQPCPNGGEIRTLHDRFQASEG